MTSSAGRNCCFLLLLAFSFLSFTSSARAQVGVYGMFSAGHYTNTDTGSGTLTAEGGTFGVYDNFAPLGPIKLGGDGRFFIQSSSNSTPYGNKLAGFIFGPRLAISLPAVPIKPYIQAEIGGVGSNNGDSSSKSYSFAYQVNGGIDLTILPHVDIRGEYGAGQAKAPSADHTLQEFGLGLVLRL